MKDFFYESHKREVFFLADLSTEGGLCGELRLSFCIVVKKRKEPPQAPLLDSI